MKINGGVQQNHACATFRAPFSTFTATGVARSVVVGSFPPPAHLVFVIVVDGGAILLILLVVLLLCPPPIYRDFNIVSSLMQIYKYLILKYKAQ